MMKTMNTSQSTARLLILLILVTLVITPLAAYADNESWAGEHDLKFDGVLKVNEFGSSNALIDMLRYELSKDFALKVVPSEEFTYSVSPVIPTERWHEKGTEIGDREASASLTLKGRLFGYKDSSYPDVVYQVMEGEADFHMTMTTHWDPIGSSAPTQETQQLDYTGPFFIVLTDMSTGNAFEETSLVLGNTYGYLYGLHESLSPSLKDYYPQLTPEVPVTQTFITETTGSPTKTDQYELQLPYTLFNDIHLTSKLPSASVVVDNAAAESSGETSVDVSSRIVNGSTAKGNSQAVGVAVGIAMASALLGLMGASGPSKLLDNKTQQTGSNRYQMRIRKEFGDQLRYGAKGNPVFARMVEITPEGLEIDRPDLTAAIQIFSENGTIGVGPATISGNYVSAIIEARTIQQAPTSQGVVSFRFTGLGGTFQNNITFQCVGEPSIQLQNRHKDSLYIPSGSHKTYSVIIEPVDFMAPPEFTLGTMTENAPFQVDIQKTTTGKSQLVVTDHSDKKSDFEPFYETYALELRGHNAEEQASTTLRLILCHEGLWIAFIGGKNEVKGYYDIQSDRMAETLVDFKLGVWDDTSETLVFQVPKDLTFTYSDEARISDLIGLKAEKDLDHADKTVARYVLSAEKPYPNAQAIPGELTVGYTLKGDVQTTCKQVPLTPDILLFDHQASIEKEYQNCLYMIKAYLPEAQAIKLKTDLEARRELNQYGAEDYRIYRQYVWDRAQYYIFVEKRDYMREASYYEDLIKLCEWTQWLGDIALEIALMPIGGPLVTFVLKNTKGLLVTFLNAYSTKGKVELSDVADYISAMLGGLDDISGNVPGPAEYKKLVLWLSCFYIYRLFYNRLFNKATDSWSEAIIQALKDLSIKALLAEFVARKVGQADDHAHLKVSNGAEITYNTYQDASLMKPLTDIGDDLVNAMDQKSTTWLNGLYTYLDDIVDGKITL